MCDNNLPPTPDFNCGGYSNPNGRMKNVYFINGEQIINIPETERYIYTDRNEENDIELARMAMLINAELGEYEKAAKIKEEILNKISINSIL